MLVFLILSYVVIINADLNSPTIQLNSGSIKGEYVQSNAINRYFYSFRGIPFAEPPTGELRFQPPVIKKAWQGVLETRKDGSPCVQGSGGSEDCLFLNVYTPTLPSTGEKSKSLPVMVYIHGGGFVLGSSDSTFLGPDYLVDKNVILVTFNYRLNIFGFLNALEESAPGNVGLKDMILALKWVQENIERFNGDKNEITIFGHSAGSGAVQYLLQTHLAKGLFNRAIMQSGCTLNPWAFETNPLEMIRKVGKVLNIKYENITQLVHELKSLSAKDLFSASIHLDVLNADHVLTYERFVPSLEIDSPKSFMMENSYSLLSENKINSVPFIIGYVSLEALFFLKDIENGKLKLEEYEKDPTKLVPKALNIKNDSEKKKSVSEEIRKHYYNGGSLNNVTGYFNFQSDDTFARGIRKSAELLRKNNDIYFYVFGYKNESEKTEYSGVAHVDELKYIFYTGCLESEKDKMIREKMTTLWSNFAKTGDPTPTEDAVVDNIKWPKLSRSNNKFHYLDIDEKLTIKENPNQENFDFWEKIFKKYGVAPFLLY